MSCVDSSALPKCARRLQIAGVGFVTFDLRQALAARSMGFTVLGA